MGSFFDLAGKQLRIKELEAQLNDPALWSDQQRSKEINSELKSLQKILAKYGNLLRDVQHLTELFELFREQEENDPALISEIKKVSQELASFELLLYLSGKHDRNDAIVSINAGAGGTDAQDWAQMLLRMYLRWCEQNNFETELVEISEGEEAGIKSTTFLVRGDFAYGYLTGEVGVHRLVRISPFNANDKRQTSFASVEVIPDISFEGSVNINPADLRVDTYRASGAGGQHINKTDSAVRITHLPTNTVVQCQNQRSQIQNRETAMNILKSRLMVLEEQKHLSEMAKFKDTKSIGWGNQIRSYVFHPYSLVKDHRFDTETSDVTRVMDGGLELFIEAYLKNKNKEK